MGPDHLGALIPAGKVRPVCRIPSLTWACVLLEPIHPDTVSSLMTTLVKSHNDRHPDWALPHARLHDLRHVHATTLLLAGAQVHVVAARLGHADPSITLRVYAHVISNQLAEAADIFARIMKAAG